MDDLTDGTVLLHPKLEFELRAVLAQFSSERIVNDDGATIRQSFDRVAHIAWHNPHHARSSNLLGSVDGQFEFTFNDLVDFFLRVEMLVDRRTAFEVVVGERHARRMKIATVPAR